MPFPKDFYRSENYQFTLQNTALPTGILRSPLDLASHPRPWIMVNQSLSQKSDPQKKTLIFADHLFAARSRHEQELIIEKLTDAHITGFEILILEASGQLKKWNDHLIPSDYELDIELFTNEYIRTLVYQALHISANQLHILNYFGLNALLNNDDNFIDFKLFNNQFKKFFSLIKTSEHSSYQLQLETEQEIANLLSTINQQTLPLFDKISGLIFGKIDFDEIDCELLKIGTLFNALQSVKFIDSANFRLILKHITNKNNKIHHIQVNKGELDQSYLDILFSQSPKIISFDSCSGLTDAFLNLDPLKLAQLKEINFSSTPISRADFKTILNATTALQKLSVQEGKKLDGVLETIPANKLEQIKEANFYSTKITVSDLRHLLQSTHLEKLVLSRSGYFTDVFSAIDPHRWTKLKVISLGCSHITPLDLKAIIAAAPGIEILDLLYCEIAGALQTCRLDHLKNLKEFYVSFADITVEDLCAVLKSAVGLEKLSIEGFQGIAALTQGINFKLKCLKEIYLTMSDVTILDFKNILNIAPRLETVIMHCTSKIGNYLDEVKELPLNHIKNLDFAINSYITAPILNLILQASPLLKKFRINFWSKNLFGGFQQLLPTQLLNLRTVILMNSEIGAKDINALMLAAPNLNSINLYNNKNLGGSFKNLKPASLLNLEEINFTGAKISCLDAMALLNAAPNLKNTEALSNTVNMFAAPKQKLNHVIPEDWFDVNLKPKKLTYVEYFAGIAPGHYRLTTWRPDLSSSEYKEELNVSDFKPIILDDTIYENNPQFKCHTGVMPVAIKDGKALVLPSLNAHEKLFSLEVIGADKKRVNLSEINIQHNAKSGFYRIILPKAQTCTIYFKVAIDTNDFKKDKLPKSVEQALNDYVINYKAKTGINIKKFATLGEFAIYLRKIKVGSCFHRSIAAYHELFNDFLQKKHIIDDVQIIKNATHAYIEVKKGDRWFKRDLGGYPATLEKLPMPMAMPDKVVAHEKTNEVITPATPSDFKEQALDQSLIESQKPSLIIAGNDVDLLHVYTRIREHYPVKDILTLHHPQELSLTGFGMTKAGEIKAGYTHFSEWLKHHQNQSGVICVDIRKFDAMELAQLNDLLDREIENQKIPTSIKIILIDDTLRGYYGPDFRRRVPRRSKVLTSNPNDLLSSESLQMEPQKIIEIDLFNSLYWQRLLMGTWQMYIQQGETDFSFRWQKGELLTALSAKQIVFKNPPLHDPSFTCFIAELQSLRRISWADQVTTVPEDISFSQSEGFDWQRLKKQTSLHSVADIAHLESAELPHELSDANILSFIQDPAYYFSPFTNQLATKLSYLSDAVAKNGYLDVMCVPGLSKGALSQLLTEAEKRHVHVRFYLPNSEQIPSDSPLNYLFQPPLPTSTVWQSHCVDFQLSDDPYFVAKKILWRTPHAKCFDITALEASELGYMPLMLEQTRLELMKTGKLSLHAKMSSLLQQHDTDITLFYGKIPSHLYEGITSLTLGKKNGHTLKGQFIIIAPPDDAHVMTYFGSNKPLCEVSLSEKLQLLVNIYPAAHHFIETIHENIPFAELEKRYLNTSLSNVLSREVAAPKRRKIENITKQNDIFNFFELEKEYLAALNSWEYTFSNRVPQLSDEDKARYFDEQRIGNVQQGLMINPWVMIEGATGIGKTHFLQHILPQYERVVFNLQDWLHQESNQNENIILIVDEASFASELSGESENFLERFKSLKGEKPGFLWKGEHYSLSAQHKVIFAFNPASYGAGRSTKGFLSDHALSIHFESYPDYYVHANIVNPMLQKLLPEWQEYFAWIAHPLVKVYQWITSHSRNESLITPREVKAMVNLIASNMYEHHFTQNKHEALLKLAAHFAVLIGRQTLQDCPKLLNDFDQYFKLRREVFDHIKLPTSYLSYQDDAYCTIKQMLAARKWMMREINNYPLKERETDLGLGGILLEGASGIGKTHFLAKMMAELEKENKENKEKIYRISASTPFAEKEKLLRIAFNEGALVVAEEWNTSLWPNKMLNHFMMGVDEDNKPATRPGFMMIATQNPPSFQGRVEEDPAIRKRIIKIKLEWPFYQALALTTQTQQTTSIANHQSGLFYRAEAKNTESPRRPSYQQRSRLN